MGKLLVQLHKLLDSLRTGYVKYPWKGRCFNVKMVKKRIDQVFTQRSKAPTVDFLYSSSLFPSFSLPFLDGKKEFQSLYEHRRCKDKYIFWNVLIWKENFFYGLFFFSSIFLVDTIVSNFVIIILNSLWEKVIFF